MNDLNGLEEKEYWEECRKLHGGKKIEKEDNYFLLFFIGLVWCIGFVISKLLF